MSTSTIFLRQPVGIAIESAWDKPVDEVVQYFDQALDGLLLVVTRRRDGARLLIPTDNVASIEVR